MQALPQPKFQMDIYQTLGKKLLKMLIKEQVKDLTMTFPDAVDANEGCSKRENRNIPFHVSN